MLPINTIVRWGVRKLQSSAHDRLRCGRSNEAKVSTWRLIGNNHASLRGAAAWMASRTRVGRGPRMVFATRWLVTNEDVPSRLSRSPRDTVVGAELPEVIRTGDYRRRIITIFAAAISHILHLNRWSGGATGRALDLRSTGRGFTSYSGQKLRNNLGQVVHTYMCLCHQAV